MLIFEIQSSMTSFTSSPVTLLSSHTSLSAIFKKARHALALDPLPLLFPLHLVSHVPHSLINFDSLLKREALHLKHYPSISTVALFIPLFCFSAFFHNSYHLTYYKFRVLIYHLSPSSIISSRG